MVRRTRRLWSDEEKRSICLQTTAPDVSVAQVARRYAVNANMVFKWLRDPRYAPEALASADAPQFLPVEIIGRACGDDVVMAADPVPAPGMIEIELAGGQASMPTGHCWRNRFGSHHLPTSTSPLLPMSLPYFKIRIRLIRGP